MSSNNTNSTIDQTTEFPLVAYYPLFLIIVGTTLNLLTFIILCRAPFRNTKKQPAMHYMRAMAIFDILMLYGWNLDHYLTAVHDLSLLKYSIISCKSISFISYFAPQTSAWLRVFACFDRYLSLSRLNRTWFNRSRNILIIITSIIGIFAGFNFHLILFACYIDSNSIIRQNAASYIIYPLWDYIHLVIYNCIPFICMVILDSSVICHLIRLRNTTTVRNSRIQHRSISITLVMTTSLFLIMTIPAGFAFSVFYEIANRTALRVIDALYFTYHVLPFLLYMCIFTEFRREFIAMITCSNTDRIAPLNVTSRNMLNTTRRMKTTPIPAIR